MYIPSMGFQIAFEVLIRLLQMLQRMLFRSFIVRSIGRFKIGKSGSSSGCEMVASGLKKAGNEPSMWHQSRKRLLSAPGKEALWKIWDPLSSTGWALITDLFPAEANQDKYNYLFFRTQDVFMRPIWNWKKRPERSWKNQCGGTEEERYQLAADFGALLSYPEEEIRRLIEKQEKPEDKKECASLAQKQTCRYSRSVFNTKWFLSVSRIPSFRILPVPPTWRFGQLLK